MLSKHNFLSGQKCPLLCSRDRDIAGDVTDYDYDKVYPMAMGISQADRHFVAASGLCTLDPRTLCSALSIAVTDLRRPIDCDPSE